jgi:hypothetical protein
MRRTAIVLCIVALLIGCNTSKVKKGIVSGTVTYKGQPVNGATLHFYPVAADQSTELNIPVAQDGTFRSSDIPAADYQVVVEGNPGNAGFNTAGMTAEQKAKMKDQIEGSKIPATIKFPEKYKQKETTDLKVTVGSGETKLNLQLTD